MRNAAIAIAICLFAASVAAAPPPGADPKLAPFFEGLQRFDGGGSCCGKADCREVESRGPADSPSHHWEAFIDKQTFGASAPDKWVAIPDFMVNDDPTTLPRPGKAIACWFGEAEIYTHGAREFPGGGHLICFKTPLPEI